MISRTPIYTYVVFGLVEKQNEGSEGKDYWMKNIRQTCLVGKKRKGEGKMGEKNTVQSINLIPLKVGGKLKYTL